MTSTLKRSFTFAIAAFKSFRLVVCGVAIRRTLAGFAAGRYLNRNFRLVFFTLACIGIALAGSHKKKDWPGYGGGPADIRYSPLHEINRDNVAQLQLAWSYDTADGPGDPQTQPIMVNGVLYGLTPAHKVVALDAASGKLLWRFDSGIRGRGPNRGLSYWSHGKDQRIFVGVQSFLYALNPKTGKPIPGFGSEGRIDIREGLGREPAKQSIVLTSPGIIYKDLIIVGGRFPESLPAAPGDIRAYDVRTGAQRWSFHTIPHPGEFGYDTWPKDAWTYTGAANNWPGMAVDTARGIVFVPTGSAASDFYGADRVGDDLFANCLLALDAETGKRVWHFQFVRHDVWDRDLPAAPTLVEVRQNGRVIDALAQLTKYGRLWLLDRRTGKPLVHYETIRPPQSDVDGEKLSETQVLPTEPAPYARQQVTPEILTNRTPAAHAAVLEQFGKLSSGPQFTPPGFKGTVIFP